MKLTIGQFLDAMEKNGWRKAKGQMIARSFANKDKVLRACAVGQAALNLAVEPSDLVAGINAALGKDTGILYSNAALIADIFNLNDRTGTPVPEIAKLMREKYTDKLQIKFEV